MLRLLVASCLLLSTACGGDDPSLLVDLRTDFVPGLDFVTVEVTAVPAGATMELPSSRSVITRDSFLPAGRVAEYQNLPKGLTGVRVRLRSRAGALVGEGFVEIEVVGQTGVTVVVSRDCADVECPDADPAATACWAGRCVPPSCRPGDLSTCGAAGCSADADCTAPAACGVGRCLDGVCFVGRDDSACGPMDICDPTLGCVGAPPEDAGTPTDAAMPDAGAVDAGSPLDRDTFVSEARRLLCDVANLCRFRTGLRPLLLDPVCRPGYEPEFLRQVVPWLLVGPGSGFDESAAAACLSALASVDECTDPLPTICAAAIPGTLANGTRCGEPTECQSGLCGRPGNECSSGVCVPTGSEGDACDELNECRFTLQCVSNVCRREAAETQSCATVPCHSGLLCEDGLCRHGPLLGAACSVATLGSDPCVDGNRCIGEVCTTPAASGDPCGGGNFCTDGTRCDAGRCRAVVGPGQLCAADDDCQAFYYCNGATCAPNPLRGEACTVGGAACVESLCIGGTCQLGTSGESCSSIIAFYRFCEGGCVRGMCEAPIAIGSACSNRAWVCGDDAYCDDSRNCAACP